MSQKLIKTETSSHNLRYLLIIGILVISFSLSFMLRLQPLDYGFELNEFDPFFNYRATQFIVENGFPAYFEWNDNLSWYPHGRDVSATSQVMLHSAAAVTYQAFGMNSDLYDFSIVFPVVVGSLTVIVVFALVRTIAGTTAGLLASLFFAISPIIILRGSLGWFKSEPLGLLFGLLALYLFLSGIKSDKGKISLAKVFGGGILLAFGLASWGGVQFLILPIGLFLIALPFLRKDNKFIIWTSVTFTFVFFLVYLALEGFQFGVFTTSLTGLYLDACTGIMVGCVIVKRITKDQLRYAFAFLAGTIIAGISVVSSGMINMPSFRYLNVANPLLTGADTVVNSVSEHTSPTLDIIFYNFSILIVFAGMGVWLLFQKKVSRSFKIKDEMTAFVLIIGFLGAYFTSSFVRLEIFGAISVILLSSIGIAIITSKILNERQKPRSVLIKTSFLGAIVILLIMPTVFPAGEGEINWSTNNVGLPISLLHSGSFFDISTNDWPDSMQWVKENTAEDAVIAAWWDYGYWITTLSERATLADNATLIDWQIKKIATTLFSTPDNAWRILTSDTETDVGIYYVSMSCDLYNPTHATDVCDYDSKAAKFEIFKIWNDDASPDKKYDPDIADKYPTLYDYWETEVYEIQPIVTGLDADYVLLNIIAERLPVDEPVPLYTIKQVGGDETKAFWFLKIADLSVADYFNPEMTGYTNMFWQETLLGQMIPFTPVLYVDPDNPEDQSMEWIPGYIPIYVKDVKFPLDGTGPFQLVYVSPSFQKDEAGPLTGPIIYKINKEYNPDN